MWKWMDLFLRKNNLLRCWGWPSFSKLDWGCYIMSIAKTASKKIGALICSVKFLSCEVALYLYKSTASFEPLAHRQNVASLSLSYRYYFGRCSSELAQLIPLPYSRGRSTSYADRLHDFSVTISRCYRDVYVNIFFLLQLFFLAQLHTGILCI